MRRNQEITEQLGCGVFIDIPQENKAKQESSVVPVVSVVSCPPHDWTCVKCGWNCTERDTSRRWVKPRPCFRCNTLMTTWRTSDSALPIFKPTGSIPSPRENKSRMAVKQEPDSRCLEPQPSANAPVVEGDTEPQWAISAQETYKQELTEVTTEKGWDRVNTLIPQMRSSVAKVEPPPDTWEDVPVPPPNTQFAVPVNTSDSTYKVKVEHRDQPQGAIPFTPCKEDLEHRWTSTTLQ